ncbi:MAG: ABC transporter permease [Gemmatimonadaceae bacterium]|nr:ABC transporter permease [Gemmatimonadaceae bacterium]
MSSGLPPRAKRYFRLALRRPEVVTADTDDEIRFHLDARAEQLVSRGLTPEQAREEACRRFGLIDSGNSRLRESALRRERHLRVREMLGVGQRDVRFAVRGLSRAPGFFAIAVACVALGIGANAAIYSVINGVLFRPLPFAHPERLVRVWTTGAAAPGIYELLRASNRSYEGLAGYVDDIKVSVTGVGTPIRYDASAVTANLFDVLGVRPEIGRAFVPGENAEGSNRVVLLSHAVWRARFGGDPAVLGRTINIDGVAHVIIGVMPAAFKVAHGDAQLWVPALFTPSAPSYWWGSPLRLIGRLKSDLPIEQARAEAPGLLLRARSSFPMRMPDEWGRDADVLPLQESVVGSERPTILVLSVAVGLVLLLACVNVATLYVDRAAAREREFAIRSALGAGRARVVAQLLTESLVVAGVGGAAGIAIAFVAVRALVAILPPGTPRAESIRVDAHVLAFTFILAVVSGIAFALLPALRARRVDVQSSLRKDSRTGDSPRHSSAMRTLAIVQVALAVIIVTAAALVLKSLWQLRQVDLGFDTAHVLITEIPLPSFDADTAARAPAFYNAVIERSRTVPGIRLAAAASALPFGATAYPAAMEVEAHPTPVGGVPALPVRTTVTADFFRVMRIPLLRGRDFRDSDRQGAPPVAIVDAEAARTLWPREDAVGQRIRYVWLPDWITIVGVVGNVKRDSLSAGSDPSIYMPMNQGFAQEMHLILQTSSDPDVASIQQSLRTRIAAIDPTVPVSGIRPLDDAVTTSAARTRFTAVLLGLFAILALLLAAMGIYGLMSAAVSRRTREIGIRVALGATARGIVRMVLRESAVVTIAGVACGVVGAIGVSRLLRGILFGVGSVDLVVLTAVTALLAVVAMLASLPPARRASRSDPLIAISSE